MQQTVTLVLELPEGDEYAEVVTFPALFLLPESVPMLRAMLQQLLDEGLASFLDTS